MKLHFTAIDEKIAHSRQFKGTKCSYRYARYRIFPVIRRSIFSKKFRLITFELSQIRGASHSQLFSCNKIQERPIF